MASFQSNGQLKSTRRPAENPCKSEGQFPANATSESLAKVGVFGPPHPILGAYTSTNEAGPLLRPGGNISLMCSIYHTSLRLSRESTRGQSITSQTTILHRVRIPQDEATPFCHLRCTYPSAAAQSSFSHCSWFLWAPTISVCLHDCVQNYLRRHLLEQILDDRGAGHVQPTGD